MLDGRGRVVVAHRLPRRAATVVLALRRNLRTKRERTARHNRHDNQRLVGELLRKRRLDRDTGRRPDRVLRGDVRTLHHADGVEIAPDTSAENRIRHAQDVEVLGRSAPDRQVEPDEIQVASRVRHSIRGHQQVAIDQVAGRDHVVEITGAESIAHVTDAAQTKPGQVDITPRIGRQGDASRGDIDRALGRGMRARVAREVEREARPTKRELVARDDHVVRDRLGRNDGPLARANRPVGEEMSVAAIHHHPEASPGQRGIEAVRNIRSESEPKLLPRADRETVHVDVHGTCVRTRSQIDRTREHASRSFVDQLHVPEERAAGRIGEKARVTDHFDSKPQRADLEVTFGEQRRPLEPRIVAASVNGTRNGAVVTDRHDMRRDDTSIRRSRIGRARVSRRSIGRTGVHFDRGGRAAGARVGQAVGLARDAGVATVEGGTVVARAVSARAEVLAITAVGIRHHDRVDRAGLRPVQPACPAVTSADVARGAEASAIAALGLDRATRADGAVRVAEIPLPRLVTRNRSTRGRRRRDRHSAAAHHQNESKAHLRHHLRHHLRFFERSRGKAAPRY